MKHHLYKVQTAFAILSLSLLGIIISGGIAFGEHSIFPDHYGSSLLSYYRHSLQVESPLNRFGQLASIASGPFTKSEELSYVATGSTEAVPVLLYHSIVSEESGVESVMFKNFKEQMFALKKEGWHTVTLADLQEFVAGRKELPAKSFVLTFDDGAKQSYYPVDPVLKALNFTAVTFIITKYSTGPESGSPYYLSEQELKKMLKSGRWEVGSHGREAHNLYSTTTASSTAHFMSNRLWVAELGRRETMQEFEARVKKDFDDSKSDLEQAFGTQVSAYAFPFGDYGQISDEKEWIEPSVTSEVDEHYPMAFYQVWAGRGNSFNYFGEGGYMIKRIEVAPTWSASDVLTALESGSAKKIPYRSSTFNDGWLTLWGVMKGGGDSLRLSPTASSTSAALFLDGTARWEDYLFRTQIAWGRAETASLFVRYRDNKNYTSCAFSSSTVSIQNIVNGVQSVVVKNTHTLTIPPERVWLVARVDGTTVRCYMGSTLLAEAYAVNMAPRGGIAIQIWNSVPNTAHSTIYDARVAAAPDAHSILTLMPSYRNL